MEKLKQVEKVFKDRLNFRSDSGFGAFQVYSLRMDLIERLNQKTVLDKAQKVAGYYSDMDFLLGTNEAWRDGYMKSDAVRKGFLTQGIVLHWTPQKIVFGEDASHIEAKNEGFWYFFNGKSLQNQSPANYQILLAELEKDNEGVKWDFWGGCGMEIPDQVETRLNAKLVRPNLVSEGLGQYIAIFPEPCQYVNEELKRTKFSSDSGEELIVVTTTCC